MEGQNIRELSGGGVCAQASSARCRHGTFVASLLLAKRGSAGLAIYPGCSLLVRSISPETGNGLLLWSEFPAVVRSRR